MKKRRVDAKILHQHILYTVNNLYKITCTESSLFWSDSDIKYWIIIIIRITVISTV